MLLADRDQEGVRYLTESLNIVKSMLSGSDDSISSDQEHRSQASTAIIHQESCPLSNLQDINCFIYSNALIFSLDSACPLSEDDVHIYSATIILNIALAYHRRGLTGNPSSLLKAEMMYEMITKLLGSEENHGTSLVVLLAAINNLSQLRHDRGLYDASLEGFKYLGSLINFAGNNVNISLQNEQIYKGMLLNVLLVSAPDAAAAA